MFVAERVEVGIECRLRVLVSRFEWVCIRKRLSCGKVGFSDR